MLSTGLIMAGFSVHRERKKTGRERKKESEKKENSYYCYYWNFPSGGMSKCMSKHIWVCMGGPSEKDYMYCRASPEWNSTVQFCDHAVMLDRHVSQVCVMGREKENDVCVCVRAHVCVCASAHFTHDDENSGVPHLHPHPPRCTFCFRKQSL